MSTFSVLLNIHLISIALSVGLLTLRFWWRYTDSRLACARWTRIVPPVVDTVLLLSGVLGFIALDYRRARSQQARLVAFPLALVVLYIIIKLATTKIPLLG